MSMTVGGLLRVQALLALLLLPVSVGCGQGPASQQSNGGAGASVDGGTAGSVAGGGVVGGASAGDTGGGGGSSAGDSNGGASVVQGPTLSVPIEVLGAGSPDAPTVASTTLTLASSDTSAVQALYVQCHRCGFYDPPEFEQLAKPPATVKASLRIVGSADKANDAAPWVDITDATVKVDEVPAAHGGINGAFVTLGFNLVIDEATRARLVGVSGSNKIEFRFNGTDGGSNGFRILDLQFRDKAGKNLSPATRVWADIAAEKAAGQLASASDREQGKALWTGRDLLLKSALVARKIRASCSDCHARDGRDLQYFNYSDNSIIQRSRFHGLSEVQGKQIVAYLRGSLYGAVPHVALATPWNPPFQPGPGLDSKPAVEWTAGAGLDAVLPDGKSFMRAFVGKPAADPTQQWTQADINAAMDPTRVTNMREMPVPLQFPDWNAWLPFVHPLDVWTPDAGQTAGLFEAGYQNHTPLAAYTALETWLDAHRNPAAAYGDWSQLTPADRNQLQSLLQNIGAQGHGFAGGGRGSRISSDPSKPFGVELGAQKLMAALAAPTAALYKSAPSCGPAGPCTPFTNDAFVERAVVSIYHWIAVKEWEVAEGYGLQDQKQFHGALDASGKWVGQGEARGWPFATISLFYLAPHMDYSPTVTAQGKRDTYLSWEDIVVSHYRTNQWYQMQASINPGWFGGSTPMDWPYTQAFIKNSASDLIQNKAPGWMAAMHLVRFFQVTVKDAQEQFTQPPFSDVHSRADLLFKNAPSVILDGTVSSDGSASDSPSKFRVLDEIAPGTYLMFVNAMISHYNQMFADTVLSQYTLCTAANTFDGQRYCIDAARTPLPKDSKGQTMCGYPANSSFTTAQYSVFGVMAATQAGADAALVKRWSDWNDRTWPAL